VSSSRTGAIAARSLEGLELVSESAAGESVVRVLISLRGETIRVV
jgi:hypothetical protein